MLSWWVQSQICLSFCELSGTCWNGVYVNEMCNFIWNFIETRNCFSLFPVSCLSLSFQEQSKKGCNFEWNSFVYPSIEFNIMTLTKTIRKINKQIKYRLNLKHKQKKRKCAANNENCTDFHWLSIANGTEWPGVFISAIHWFQTVQCVFVWLMVITFWDDMMLSSFKKGTW